MPAELTIHPPQRASRFRVLREGESLEVGRDPGCGLLLEDPRVSKHHALLRWSGSGWLLEDLGSKNGTTVNGRPPSGLELRAGDWISFGGLMGRFELLSASQAELLLSERSARIQTTAAALRRLSTDLEPVNLLQQFLQAAMEVTRADRGFVLVLGPQGSLHVQAANGFSAEEDVRDGRFRGSVGAVQQVLAAGEPVVVADVPADPRLGPRPSILALGIGSLACLPLCQGARILGLIYVDSGRRGPPFSALDIGILESLADHAAQVLSGHSAERRIQGADDPARDVRASRLERRLLELFPTA